MFTNIYAWVNATRPWSLTASVIPIVLGSVLSIPSGHFSWMLFVLSIIGGCSIQVGTNLINTWGDYKSGVDTIESAITCPELVTGKLKPGDMYLVGLAFFFLAIIIGIYLVFTRSCILLLLGLVGILGGYYYTAGIQYKYKGLGTILVFFLMGPLMASGGYLVQTGYLSCVPFWAAIPVGFLVSAILNGNDIRDISHDQQANVKTLALIIGHSNSINLQYCLFTATFLSLPVLCLAGFLPWTAMIAWGLLPKLISIFKIIHQAKTGDRGSAIILEGLAAQFHMLFGIILIIGILVDFILKYLN